MFEANQGQTSSRINFISRGSGYTAFLTSDGMVLSLRGSKTAPTEAVASSSTNLSGQTTLGFRLLGAASRPVARGENPQRGLINYFIGNDHTKWHRNVPTYAQVRYENIYPGIDLLYHGNQGRMEYDFIVRPGADTKSISFEVSGAKEIHTDGTGNLILATALGDLRFEAPIVFQESHGQRVPVKGQYVLEDATHVRFEVEPFDSNNSLIIDPVLTYSTYLGGAGNEQTGALVVDSAGNVYVVGSTDEPDFPTNTFGSLSAGVPHVFVAKLNPAGTDLIFCDYVGGSGSDYGYGVALDATGNVYLTGNTSSGDFPVVAPFEGTYPGSSNGFLTKISADGSNLLYSTYFGGNGVDLPAGVVVDSSGDMILAGYTSSTNLPVANAYQSSVSANQGGNYGYYGFLTKFTTDGSSLVYSTYFGGSSNVPFNCNGIPCWGAPFNLIVGLALDKSGNSYVAGTTNTYDFPATAGAYLGTNPTPSDGNIGFVSKFDTAGNLQYSTYFGDDLETNITAVAVDGSGSAYVTGLALDDGTFPITSTGICDRNVYGGACNFAFVAKFDAVGATLQYSTFLGPNNYTTPLAIALDTNNNAYVLGATGSSSFSPVNGLENYTGGSDVLLAEIDASASSEVFATFLGGAGTDQPYYADLAVDASGNIYVAGSTDSSDFPVTPSAFQTAFGGNTDAFIAKIGPGSFPGFSVTPVSIVFPAQQVGSASQTQTALLRNMGSSPLSISSTVVNGDFSETDDCGNSVAAAGSCTLSVSFSPVTFGTRLGSVVIQDNAAGSPHLLNLSGTGLDGAASPSPTNLTFPSQLVGTSSANQVVTLSNTGNANLTIGSIQATGDFGAANNCPASLAAGSACTINVSFAPTAAGTRSGSVSINDSATGSPQTVALTGTGVTTSGIAVLSPSSLTFASQVVATTSSSQAITLSNTGNGILIINSIQAAGDFGATYNCPSVAAGSSCTINVTFTPTAVGTRIGSISISDSASGSPQSVALTGTGISTSAIATLSPSSLTFASQVVGTASARQSVTLSNTGNAPMTISGIQSVGDFAETNNCPPSLAAGSACTIYVTFTPTVAGTRTGSISVNDSATGSPQSMNLSGTGVTPTATVVLSPTTLTFASQLVGTSSASQAASLSNTGDAALTISGIQSTGDFVETNNCPMSLAAGSACTISVTFTPTAAGTRTGTVNINDFATGSPQSVSLSGRGISPTAVVTVSPSSLTFASQVVGTSSASQAVNLSNTGNAALTISGIQSAGDFAATNNCPASLAAGSACTINVTFTPTVAGTRSGSLTINDSENSPQIVAVSGVGADFSLSAPVTKDTITAGSTASYTVKVSPDGGTFANAVKLSCTGAPSNTTCNLSSNSVTPGSSTVSVTVQISTTEMSAFTRTSRLPLLDAFWIQMQALGFFGLVLFRSRRRLRAPVVRITLIIVMATALVFMCGCAGGTGVVSSPGSGTNPGTYTVTVSGDSGKLNHSIALTLTVQ